MSLTPSFQFYEDRKVTREEVLKYEESRVPYSDVLVGTGTVQDIPALVLGEHDGIKGRSKREVSTIFPFRTTTDSKENTGLRVSSTSS